MKSLPGVGRNDVVRVLALVSVVAFPLIADAQLGLGSKAVKISKDASPLAGATAKIASTGRDSCADQHWPFFSSGCLRGSAQATEPRMVSTNVESPTNSAATPTDSARVGRTTDTVGGNAPVTKPKKNIKPRLAAHRRERSVSYAVNSGTGTGHMALAGW
jgi:hypothetical protein